MLCSPSENKFIQPLTLILLSWSSVLMSPRVMTVSQNISFFSILFSSLLCGNPVILLKSKYLPHPQLLVSVWSKRACYIYIYSLYVGVAYSHWVS